ncbi:MAG: hypothetical protein H7A36_02660 [Chlamydiales bacterium]|nr:hypothetical protein [Chlamydiales bacterium]
MKRFLCVLLAAASLFAEDSYFCEPDCSWSVAAEWLYFMPSFDQNAFIWDGSDTINGGVSKRASRIGEKQRYYSAYRIEASYEFCRCIQGLTARFTDFHQDYSDKVFVNPGTQLIGAPFQGVLTANPGSVFFERDYRYYNIVGLADIFGTLFCRLNTTFSAGVKFVHLHIKERGNFTNFDNANAFQFVDPDMRAWALGPCAQVKGGLPLIHCIGLKARFLFGMLADNSLSKTTTSGGPQANQNGSRYSVKNSPKLWRVMNSMEGRLGLNFEKRCCLPVCRSFMNIEVEGGYEFLREERMISRIYFPIEGAGDYGFSWNNWSDFTLNGPYMRINLSY